MALVSDRWERTTDAKSGNNFHVYCAGVLSVTFLQLLSNILQLLIVDHDGAGRRSEAKTGWWYCIAFSVEGVLRRRV